MYEYKAIFSKLRKEAVIQKKNTFIFVLLIACFTGIAIPLLSGNLSLRIQIYSVAVFSIILLRQWEAECFASEKENHTLEALLSTCIHIKTVFNAQMLFNFLLSTIAEYILIVVFACTNYIMGIKVSISASEFSLLLLTYCMIKLFVAQRITWISLVSKDVRSANSRAAKYLFGTILIVSMLVTLKTNATEYLLLIYGILILMGFVLNVITHVQLSKHLDHIYSKEYWQS